MLVAIAWQAATGVLDDPRRHPLHEAVARVDIAAPPTHVFAALTREPLRVDVTRTEAELRWPWFVAIGLPIPKRLEILEPALGGRVRIIQSTGVAHGHIHAWSPPRHFAFAIDRYTSHDPPFHITRLGRSPGYGFRSERVEDWLTIVSVRYTLEALPQNRTLLTRSIRWRRHLAPDSYFGWLQQAIIERGQVRLLTLIRETIEARAPATRPRDTASTLPSTWPPG